MTPPAGGNSDGTRAQRITSVRNERVLAARRLTADAAERRRTGLCIIEGIRIAREYLLGCGPVDLALVSPRLDELEGGAQLRRDLLLSLAGREGDLLLTTDEVLASASDTKAPQGVLLVVPSPRHDGLPEASERPILVAWELQDPGNVGSLVRTAEASGCAGVVIAREPGGAAADPYSPRAVRGAAGSAFRLPVHEWQGSPDALAQGLRDAGFRLAACVARGGLAPDGARLSGACALLIGAETRGLPAPLLAPPTTLVTIPLHGAAESLNAGAAAAVVAFEAARQQRG